MSEIASIIWRRLDMPGHEWAQGTADSEGSRLYGTAIFVHKAMPCCLEYLIECDATGGTVSAEVVGEAGDDIIELEISVDGDGNWSMNERSVPDVKGCIDIDLNFSPVTNTLPIRRLNLAVGESAEVSAAWLRFPSFELERLVQTYTRLDENTYRYSSAGGAFTRDIPVNNFGLVTEYPDYWTEEKG
jgi:uncharacterized protein